MKNSNSHSIGQNYLQNSQYQQAIEFYESLIETEADNINHYFNLGIAYLLCGDSDTAEEVWMSVLFQVDDFQATWENLLQILDQQGVYQLNRGNFDLALNVYQKLHELLSNSDAIEHSIEAIYHCNLGLAFNKKALSTSAAVYFIEAEKAYRQAINLDVHCTNAYNNLGNMFYLMNELERAEVIFEAEIQNNPQEFYGYFNLMGILNSRGKISEFISLTNRAIEQFPDDLLWRLKRYLTLPFLYQNEVEINKYQKIFISALDELINDFNHLGLDKGKKALRAIANHTNFQLAYQCFNHRDLQTKYGNLVQQIMATNFPQWQSAKINSRPKVNGKVKVGYISGCMHRHVVAKLSLGWFKNHDRSRFELYTYSLSQKTDEITEIYRQNSSYFHYIPNNLQAVVEQIMKDELDILVFLDIGMLPQMSLLASLRLAPIQCTTWCHPETSGLATVDYFLSSELMETPESDQHYSEKLIRLPNIAISYQKPDIPPLKKTRSDFDLKENAIVYFCCQSLFKYLPQHDYILASIAQKVPDSQFVFIARPNKDIALLFQNRLQESFAKFNLNLDDYCVFLSPLSGDDYLAVNQLTDIFLDSLGWSGGNTTLEALACNLPVITYPGEFMRGRHSYGILKMLGVTETIASSEQEYIDLAVRLGQDRSYREKIKNQIQKNQDKLYNDLECVHGLEEFYLRTVENLASQQ